MSRPNLMQVAISAFLGAVFLIAPLALAVTHVKDAQSMRKGEGGLAVYRIIYDVDV